MANVVHCPGEECMWLGLRYITEGDSILGYISEIQVGGFDDKLDMDNKGRKVQGRLLGVESLSTWVERGEENQEVYLATMVDICHS